MKNILCNIFFNFLALLAAAQTTYFVDASAAGTNTGQSWADAFTDLQAALAAAQAGDAIWVARGQYLPTSGADRNATFALKSGVKLYGGFAGTETHPAQRDPDAQPTILSGDIGQANDSTDNAYTILYLAYPDSSTLIDGFTFRHGIAASDTSFSFLSPVLCGGAVYVLASNGVGLPVFERCKFLDNYATGNGGAYFVLATNTLGSTPVFRHCEFRNNRAGLKGGAIYLSGGNTYDRGIEFDHCLFINNQVWSTQGQGGALYFQQNYGKEEINFLRCTMEGNFAGHIGGALSIWYSKIQIISYFIDDCLIKNNLANTQGSVLYFTQTFGTIALIVNITIINSTIQNNLGNTAERFSIFDSEVIQGEFTLENNTFVNNGPCYYLFFLESARKIVLKNNMFIDNKSIIINAANVAIKNLFIGGINPCIHLREVGPDSSDIVLQENLFINNAVPNISTNTPLISTAGTSLAFFHPPAKPIYFIGNLFYKNKYRSDLTPAQDTTREILFITNNIFHENINTATGQPGIPFGARYDSLELDFNLLDRACTDLPLRARCGPGNIFAPDPLLIDPAGGNYRPQPCSPAINAGDNTAALLAGFTQDFAGSPRILDAAVDIGPFESLPLAPAQAPAIEPACAGEPNGSVQLDLPNGCEPYQYLWSDGQQTGDQLQQLTGGIYHITVTDQKGKTYQTIVQVPAGDALQAGATIVDASGASAADGKISVIVSAGTAPFQFLWSTGDTAAQLNQLLPGAYQLTITDAAGCSFYYAYTVKYTSSTQDTKATAGTLSLRPNPASDYLYIEPGAGLKPPFQLRLTDLGGREVYRAEWKGEPVPVGQLPPGVYLAEMAGQGGKLQAKVVVER